MGEVESRLVAREGVEGLEDWSGFEVVDGSWICIEERAPSEGLCITVGVLDRCHNLFLMFSEERWSVRRNERGAEETVPHLMRATLAMYSARHEEGSILLPSEVAVTP